MEEFLTLSFIVIFEVQKVIYVVQGSYSTFLNEKLDTITPELFKVFRKPSSEIF